MDMLHGPLIIKILKFAFPIIMGSVLQQLFSAVDIAVVGMTGDSFGQAAIGANTTIIALFVNFFVGISVGINVIIGNYIGSDHKERISETVHTAILFSALSGIGMMFVVELIAKPVLVFMSTPADVLDMAVRYLRIYACGSSGCQYCQLFIYSWREVFRKDLYIGYRCDECCFYKV